MKQKQKTIFVDNKVFIDQAVFKTFKTLDDVLAYLKKDGHFWQSYELNKPGQAVPWSQNVNVVYKHSLKIIVEQDGNQLFDEEETKTLISLYNALQQQDIELVFVLSELGEDIAVDKALEASRKVNAWVDEINSARRAGKELSPYEKYIYAYDIVTQFIYKEVEQGQDKRISRNLITALTGDRIVCVGYARLLSEICNRLGIPCCTQGVNRNHEICYVRIDDDKWGIHGIYAANPTDDSQKPTVKGVMQGDKKQGFAQATILHEDYIKSNVLTVWTLLKNGEDQTSVSVKALIKFFSDRDKKSSHRQIEELLHSPTEIPGDTTMRALIASLISKNLSSEEQLKVIRSKDTHSFAGTNTIYHSSGVSV